ncbi:amino acid ABC transporter permease [Calidifontibacter terrae]
MSAGVLFDAPGPKARRRHLVLSGVGILLFLAVLYVVVMRLSDKGQLESRMWAPFTKAQTWNDYIIPGLLGTLKAAAISIVIAGIVGFLFAMGRMSEIAALRWVCATFVEVFRAVPVLIMMLFVYGMLTTNNLVSSDNAPLVATVTALVLYNASVMAEVVRAGVGQLPSGQREAGLSIGLTSSQTLRTIQLPQAITAMLPAIISQLVVVLKDTALGYNVLYGELLYQSQTGGTNNANIVPTLIVVAILFILINYSISKLAEYIDRRLKARGRGVKKQQVPGGPAIVQTSAD